MTSLKATKRALFSSAIALVLCFAMLLGTTFAWFTDSAVSSGNVIKTGTLDVALYQWTSADNGVEITGDSAPIFAGGIEWEPGRTEVRYLSIKNKGTLDLQYKAAIQVADGSYMGLLDVMSYAITPDAQYGDVTAWDAANAKELSDGKITVHNENVALKSGEQHFFALSIHMDEAAGNEYQNKTIQFDIQILAGQLASENDSFGNTYDKYASYPGMTAAPAFKAGESAKNIAVTDNNGAKLATFEIPAAAAEAGADIKVVVEESNYKSNTIVIPEGKEFEVYEINVEGLKDGNTVGVKTGVRLPTGMDPTTVSVFHVDQEIDSSYSPTTGYVTFETTGFSPFTFVYDAESTYVAPEIPKDEEGVKLYPTAKVEYLGVNAGEDNIAWGSYDPWSPTAGLEANLEASFKFSCPAESELTKAYREWYCDFYVSLDKDLGENQIFLGGNYGSFGWVGFHNGNMTLAANEEIGLLESVTTNPWTYGDVEDYVGEFICGVGDVEDALEGATFTVKLRLTNPANEKDFIDVNVVTYTFGVGSKIDGKEVVLAKDFDLNNSEDFDFLNGLLGGN